MPYVTVEVDVDISEFQDDELLDEIENRGLTVNYKSGDVTELIEKIFQLRRTQQAYQNELDELFSTVLGRIL